MTEAPIVEILKGLKCEGYEFPAGYTPAGYDAKLQEAIDLARADAVMVEIALGDEQRYKARIAKLEVAMEKARDWIDDVPLLHSEYELDNTEVINTIARALNLEPEQSK